MKNKVIYTFLALLVFFSFSNGVSAKVKTDCKPKNDTSKCYVNTGSDADNDYLILDKSKIVKINNDVVGVYIPEIHTQSISINEPISYNNPIILYTSSADEFVNNNSKWYSNLYVCKEIDWGFMGWIKSRKISAFTSSMLSRYAADNEAWYKNIIGGTDSNCWTYRVQDVPVEDQISYCHTYEDFSDEIENYSKKYAETKNPDYISDYKKVLNKIKNSCGQVMAGADYDDACVTRCKDYATDKAEWDKLFEITRGKTECGFSERLIGFIVNILKWIKYIIPVAVIILGILDFIKAIGSDKESEMKKAQGRFVKRLIAAALIFIVPLIIVFVLEKMGFVVEGCDIIDL